MAALTAHRGYKKRNMATLTEGATLIETSAVVQIGALLVADATTGLAKVAADIGAAGSNFLGICTGFAYHTSLPETGVIGDGTILAKWETGIEVLLPCAGTVNAADNNKAAYCLDSSDVTDVSTAGPGCGIFVANESATTAWVRLNAAVMPAAT